MTPVDIESGRRSLSCDKAAADASATEALDKRWSSLDELPALLMQKFSFGGSSSETVEPAA